MDKKSQLIDKMADLTPAQRALLEKRMKGKGLGGLTQMVQKQIPRRTIDGPVPLSSAQQRLWVVEQFDPGNVAYNIPTAVRMTGDVDLSVLERALNEVIRRHESLRTTFATVDEQPVQVIAPELVLSLPVLDLRPQFATLAEREAEVEKIAVQESKLPFDLERGPLLRALVLQVEQGDYVLVLVMHHIVSDGWSMGIVVQELCALYMAFAKGQPSPLPALPIQYGDFAIWQRNWLQGETMAKQLDYWKRQLGGTLPILQLPTDFPRPLAQTFHGTKVDFHLPKAVVAALQELCAKEGATLFMVLIAAYKALLYRYTGQEDLLVGTPIANRNRGEIEPLIGVFVNTLVLRTEVSGELTFRELLARVRQVAVDGFANQDVPFEQLVDVLQPERNISHPVLVQSLFVLQNTPMGSMELPGVNLSWENVDNKTSKFDLSMNLFEEADGVRGELEYNTDLFAEETVARMAAHFVKLVERAAAQPDQKVAELPLLTDAERQRLLVEWNETASLYPLESVTVQSLFEAQVERTPDRVAVDAEGRELTFRELNSRANRLANRLQKRGVGPETMVGVCMERSLEMIVALLGVLKSGGAYVPIDPGYPADRIAYVMEDAATPVLLTQSHLLGVLPEHQAHVICLDSEWETMADEDEANVVSGATPNSLAYVIYTSGSTGKPKGAMIEQHNVCNRLLWQQEQYPLTPEDRVLQKTPFSFDVSVWEFFLPMITGARLVMAKPGGHQESEYLKRIIMEKGITATHFVPSMLQLFLDEPGVEQCTTLRVVMAGGEAVTYDLAEKFFAKLNATLVDFYGPTECTVDSTSWVVRSGDSRKTVPIGRPVANTQVYILDKHLQPVPVGVAGELHIAGEGVGRGYHNRPDLTAEKFIVDPFGAPDGRMYKTGDLVRYRADGAIEYLGRIDFQVKIRGFRIELEEIEATMLAHEAIDKTVVMAREDVPGIKRLVAYMVPVRTQQAPTTGELRTYLAQHLPEYMVPSFFVTLDSFPLSPNGKVDRKALPAPDLTRPEMEQAFVAATNETEETLAGIWAQVLGVQQVGVQDNFFELGGDSILAIQVVNKAKQAGLQLTPKQLFENPNIAKLARVAGSAVVVQAEQGIVTGEVPLTPIQQYFLEEQSPEPHYFNQALLLEVRKSLEKGLLEQAIQALLVQHDALRMRFVQAADGAWRQVNADLEETPVFATIDLSHLANEAASVQAQALEEAIDEVHRSLDLAAGPLVRAVYFDLGADRPGRLLLLIHHLVVDGVSWRILLEDLHTALAHLEQGQEVQLPPKTTSFKQWAEKLQQYAQTEAVQAELSYWAAEARRNVIGLPVDNRNGVNDDAGMRTVTGALTAEETSSLLQEVPSVYNTQINDALLTGLAQAVTGWSGANALLVDLEGHGRETLFPDADISRTVGWFTTIFPVLLTVRKTAPMGEKLKAIKEQLRAVPSRGIGYGLLRYLNEAEVANGGLHKLPQAEVVFNYLGQLDQVLPDASPFGTAKESPGRMRTPLGKRRYLLEIDASIVGGQLQVRFHFGEQIHKRATVERLLQQYLEALRAIIAHCKDPNSGGYTPSDFSKAKMNQKDLNKLLGKLSKGGK